MLQLFESTKVVLNMIDRTKEVDCAYLKHMENTELYSPTFVNYLNQHIKDFSCIEIIALYTSFSKTKYRYEQPIYERTFKASAAKIGKLLKLNELSDETIVTEEQILLSRKNYSTMINYLNNTELLNSELYNLFEVYKYLYSDLTSNDTGVDTWKLLYMNLEEYLFNTHTVFEFDITSIYNFLKSVSLYTPFELLETISGNHIITRLVSEYTPYIMYLNGDKNNYVKGPYSSLKYLVKNDFLSIPNWYDKMSQENIAELGITIF